MRCVSAPPPPDTVVSGQARRASTSPGLLDGSIGRLHVDGRWRLRQELGDLSERAAFHERVSVTMNPPPDLVRSAEDLGHAQIPSTLVAWGIADQFHRAPFDHHQPYEVTVRPTIHELDRPGATTPPGSDGALSLCRRGPAKGVAAYCAEDRPVPGNAYGEPSPLIHAR